MHRFIIAYVICLAIAPALLANPLNQEACPPGASTALQQGTPPRSLAEQVDVFTNHGSYMPRTHCMVTSEGSTDWPWVIALVLMTCSVIGLYARIYSFWRKCYLEEDERDRNPAMMRLANIFFWCAICGYGMSIVMFVWPAYRLLTIFLFILSVWSWRFVVNISDFKISLSARRLERELTESLESRNRELEQLVAHRTAELEKATAAAESANEAKSTFLANMSHEIRTPITSIMGYTKLASDVSTEPETQSQLATISRNANHLLTLVNDVLDLSKVEAGEMTIERIETDTAELIRQCIDVVAPRAHAKGLEIRASIESPIPAVIRTDPTRVRQVLFNILTNAVKFTEQGSITLAAQARHKAADQFDIEFAVIDTGIGIPPERLDAIFNPFEQADASTTRRFGGTGLGLPISRRIANLLDGDLIAESSFDQGSRFIFEFPTTTPDPARTYASLDDLPEPAQPLKASPLILDARILVVEDTPDIARLVQVLLERAGAIVQIATTASHAIEIASTEPHFDLYIVDGQLPDEHGIEVTRAIRLHGATAPILAFTAHATPAERADWVEAGCSDYLPKPIDPAEFVSLCAQWLTTKAAPAKAA